MVAHCRFKYFPWVSDTCVQGTYRYYLFLDHLVACVEIKNDKIFFDRAEWLENKNVLVVDDIIRSGKTLWLLKNHLAATASSASLTFFALFRAVSLSDKRYGITALAKETDWDAIFPWDN